MPILILAGEEEYLISKKVRILQEQLVDQTWASFNFARLENPDLKQVIDAAATLPFGPGNRMVLFDSCMLFTKKKGTTSEGDGGKEKGGAKLVDDFEAALGSVVPNTYLVFACPNNFDRSLKNSKAAEKHAKLESFDRLKFYPDSANTDLISFCTQEARQYQVSIDPDAVFYLAESTEVNLRQMSKEIEKAAIYILPDKHITLEHVTLLSPHFSHVFALMEHWALHHSDKVLESIQELQARQVSAHMIVAAMQTVISKWIMYKAEYERAAIAPGGGREVRRREVPFKEVAARIDSRMAFMIEKDLKRIKNLTLEYLVEKKKALTDLEFLLKSGQVPEAHALEMFFTR